jgi:hypothetical protein
MKTKKTDSSVAVKRIGPMTLILDEMKKMSEKIVEGNEAIKKLLGPEFSLVLPDGATSPVVVKKGEEEDSIKMSSPYVWVPLAVAGFVLTVAISVKYADKIRNVIGMGTAVIPDAGDGMN